MAGNIAIAVGGGSFDEAQLPDVPGNGSLCHLEALLAQMIEKYLLSADGMLLNEAEDCLLTFRLAFCLSWIVSAHIPCLLLLLSPASNREQRLIEGSHAASLLSPNVLIEVLYYLLRMENL